MNNNELSELVSALVGLPIWKITVGATGLNLKFGEKIKNIKYQLNDGEISLWYRCNVRIYRTMVGGELIAESLYPQSEKEKELFEQYFENKVVLDAFYREKDNSIHFIVEPDVILSAYPWKKESEKCWTIFDRRMGKTKWITVYTDDIVVENN